MNPDSQDFEQLRHLLAIKRHEQPPPGYFHHFSREVIVRIKAGEVGEPAQVSWWSVDGTWIQKMWGFVNARPVLTGSLGVAFCGFFVATSMLETGATADMGIKGVPQEYVSSANLAASVPDSVGASSDFPNLIPASVTVTEAPKAALFAQPANFEWQQQPRHSLVVPVNFQGN